MLEFAASTEANQFRQGFAGDTFNTCVYLARLLPDAAVSYVTAIGEDSISKRFLAALRTENIDTSLVVTHPEKKLGLYVIENDDRGERTFHYWRNDAAVRYLFDRISVERLARSLVSYDLVYLSGISLAVIPKQPLAELVNSLVKKDVKLAFDPNYRPGLWPTNKTAELAMGQLGSQCDYLLTTLGDDQQLNPGVTLRQSFQSWRELGTAEIVIKDGANGAYACSAEVVESGSILHQEAETTAVIDTTGAGDAFNAAYLSARLAGLTIARALIAGNALASKVILHRGAILPR